LLASLFFSCSDSKIDLTSLHNKIENILQLETAEYVYRDLMYKELGSSFIGITTRDTRLLAELKIRVVAGVDAKEGIQLSRIKNEQNEETVRVSLAPAKILFVDADEDSIHQFMLKEYGFADQGRISLLEFTDQLKENKEAAQKDAVNRGILQKAENNAKILLKNLLSAAGYPKAEIVFKTHPEQPEILANEP